MSFDDVPKAAGGCKRDLVVDVTETDALEAVKSDGGALSYVKEQTFKKTRKERK